MNDALKLPRIVGKKLDVVISPLFDSKSYYRGKPNLEAHVLDIVDAIAEGKPLPRWAYRAGIDDNYPPDKVLSRYGIMHLHLGKKSSSELLFLMQFDDHVVILEIGNHNHFREDPPGSLLHQFHLGKVEEINRARDEKLLEDLAATALAEGARRQALEERTKAGILPRESRRLN